MKTAIFYYSKHHSNTYRLLEAIASNNKVDLLDVTAPSDIDLSKYDRIGIASGIYYGNYAKQITAYAEKHLPEEKPVFYIYTHGAEKGDFLRDIRNVVRKKNCTELGEYHCRGYDTYGPFKLIGGIAKGHPTEDEIQAAVSFYNSLKTETEDNTGRYM